MYNRIIITFASEFGFDFNLKKSQKVLQYF
mgnify:CR=1 FL=1